MPRLKVPPVRSPTVAAQEASVAGDHAGAGTTEIPVARPLAPCHWEQTCIASRPVALLFDQALVKTNHLRALAGSSAQPIRTAVDRLRRNHPRRFVELEVTNLHEFMAALLRKPSCLLLDNLPLRTIRHLVRLRNALHPATRLEVSGGVTLANVRAIARTGVDRISIGALTKSAPSLDFAVRVLINRKSGNS